MIKPDFLKNNIFENLIKIDPMKLKSLLQIKLSIEFNLT